MASATSKIETSPPETDSEMNNGTPEPVNHSEESNDDNDSDTKSDSSQPNPSLPTSQAPNQPDSKTPAHESDDDTLIYHHPANLKRPSRSIWSVFKFWGNNSTNSPIPAASPNEEGETSNEPDETKVSLTKRPKPHFSPGVCGLSNLGNTCFMNSALQCLSNTQPLTKYFLSNSFKKSINKSNPLGSGGQLATEYAHLVREMWSGRNSSVSPQRFKRIIGKLQPRFSGFAQHDSQELLAYVLDGIHEDLNEVKTKPYREIREDYAPDEEMALRYWKLHRERNKSVIVDQFQGQLKSTVTCPLCKNYSRTFDPFTFLSLPLPAGQWSYQRICIFPYQMSARPQILVLKLDKNGSISDISQQLEQYFPLIDPERWIFSIASNSRIQIPLQGTDPISQLPSDANSGSLFAFIGLEKWIPNPAYVEKNDGKENNSHTESEEKSPSTESSDPATSTTTPEAKNQSPQPPVETPIIPKNIRHVGVTLRFVHRKKSIDQLHLQYYQKTKYRVDLFANPFLIEVSVHGFSVRVLYELVWTHLKRIISPELHRKCILKQRQAKWFIDHPQNDENLSETQVSSETPGTAGTAGTAAPTEPNDPTETAETTETNETNETNENIETNENTQATEKTKNTQATENTAASESTPQKVIPTNSSNATSSDNPLPPHSQAKSQIPNDDILCPPDEDISNIIPDTKFLPFNLAILDRHNPAICKQCDYYSNPCTGCFLNTFDKNRPLQLKRNDILGIDWVSEYLEPTSQLVNVVELDKATFHPSYQAIQSEISKPLTLKDCLSFYTRKEQLSRLDKWNCPKCKQSVQATKAFDIWSTPQVLIVHMKRFHFSSRSRSKISTQISFPRENLDLSSFVKTKNGIPPIYDLIAISNHSGSMGFGHYTAFGKNYNDKNWYNFNDSHVSRVNNTTNLISPQAYMLFFQRRNPVLNPPKLLPNGSKDSCSDPSVDPDSKVSTPSKNISNGPNSSPNTNSVQSNSNSENNNNTDSPSPSSTTSSEN